MLTGGGTVGLLIVLLHRYDSPLMIDPNQTVVCGSSAAAWFAGVGTIVLAFVAVFQQWLQQLIVRPRLRLSARVSRPPCPIAASLIFLPQNARSFLCAALSSCRFTIFRFSER